MFRLYLDFRSLDSRFLNKLIRSITCPQCYAKRCRRGVIRHFFMLSKKHKLPIQRLSKKPDKIVRTTNLTLKIYFSDLSYPRVGVVISKKVAKSAVKRNELKRTVFNCFKVLLPKLSPADYLVIINKELTKEELVKEINNPSLNLKSEI